MRLFAVLLVMVLGLEAQALQLIKCGSVEGKTLYASFGTRRFSDPNKPNVIFPIEFTVFSGRQALQDRIIYDRTEDALKIPVQVSQAAIAFAFPAQWSDGQTRVSEQFQLRIISPKDPHGFQGTWASVDDNGKVLQTVFTMCSAF